MSRGVHTCCGVLAVALAVLLTCSAGQADLAHRYSFDTDGDTNDSVGTAHATAYGDVVWSFLDHTMMLTNDGTAQRSNDQGVSPPADPPGAYIDLPNGTISSLGNQATFETWFKWDGGGIFQRVFDFGTANGGENDSSGGSDTSYVMLTPKANYGKLAFYVHSDDGSQTVLTTDVVSTRLEGVENHLVVSWDGANDMASVYCNGMAVGHQFGLKISLENLVDNNNWLGRSQWNDLMLDGSFNEFRIYDEALSAAQVYKNSQDGPAAAFTRVTPVTAAKLTSAPVHRYSFNGNCDDSIGTAHGALINNTGNSAFAGGKLTLGNDGTQRSGDLEGDTSGDYVDLPNGMISALEDNATFEAWITWDSANTSIWQRIFDFGTSQGGEDVSDSGADCSYIMATPRSTGSQSEFGNRYADTNEDRYATAPGQLETGVESHVVCVWDGDNDRTLLYLDGEFAAVNETLYDLSDLVDVNNWLGRAQYSDLMFEGSYNEFRVYDYALTAEEVLGNYQAGANKVNTPGSVDIPGDTDHDGDVDADDAQNLATYWGKATGATWEMGDFNEDGAVNVKDAAILAANWNPDGSGESVASVPEPSVLLMVLCGLTALFAGGRRTR